MSSYKDFLNEGETLHSSIEQYCEILESKGWYVHVRRGEALRFWCACPTEHQLWLDLKSPLDETRINFTWRTTCLTS